PTCAFKLISGKNKDSLCSKKPLINGKYCSIHQKKINQVQNVIIRTPTPEKIPTLIKPTEETNQIIPVETPRRPNPGKMEITKAVTFNPLKCHTTLKNGKQCSKRHTSESDYCSIHNRI